MIKSSSKKSLIFLWSCLIVALTIKTCVRLRILSPCQFSLKAIAYPVEGQEGSSHLQTFFTCICEIERYRPTYGHVNERIALILNRRKGQMFTFWYPLFEIIWLLCKVLPWLLKHPITCLLHQFQSHLTRLCFAYFVARGLRCRLRYIPACAAHNVVLMTAIR